jgi:hypothetical protein
MRIWSIHPKYLDSKGLVALWRESLLARHVLEGKTAGYRNHPQLDRFKKSDNPVDAINLYLKFVYLESKRRKYNFDKKKLGPVEKTLILKVTTGQLNYEFNHFLTKLKTRDLKLFEELIKTKIIEPHPIFEVIKGEIENFEILKK